MRRYLYIFLSSILLVVSCKSVKTAKDGAPDYTLSTRQLFKANEKQEAQFKTLQARLKITFSQNGNSQTHTVTFRAQKDKVLWMNASFSVIRAMITPEKVSFYNKIDNTYFDGDYKYLSDLLGTTLDFNKVQNLLMGETLYPLSSSEYVSAVDNQVYVVQPKVQRELFEIFFLLNPSNFKVKSQQITQPQELRHLQIDYESFQKVNNQVLPETVKVIAVEANEETIINLEFKNVSLNEALRFPFKIPSGFEKIEL
ncbi:DUF4292 domain-containing protein [Tamlana fucoidanivorans]|uniref:DUF4292 domain-containing protein n=1 Tax=Allotamlana fucoidanivorans TaxID=2583814 RepID=A0A5C4SRI4_9FLAO|nr:DUF4292 domain-containing protein [Tamlana fucoidanivorans]TNJ47010.1 DUF4292 domain-containing protein [Tamlana fucoidanivorans]